MHNLDAIAVMLRAAEASGMPQRLLEAARAEILDLQALAGMADPRRLETYQRGLRIERLLAQRVSRPDVCERLGISTDAYHRSLRELRVSRNCLGVNLNAPNQENANVDLKSVSLGIGAGTPAPLSKYGSTARPAAPKGETPRDGGMLADGGTGGNYNGAYMAQVGVNSAGKADAAAESAQETFEENGQ